jgi:hypothetical protein
MKHMQHQIQEGNVKLVEGNLMKKLWKSMSMYAKQFSFRRGNLSKRQNREQMKMHFST